MLGEFIAARLAILQTGLLSPEKDNKAAPESVVIQTKGERRDERLPIRGGEAFERLVDHCLESS